jgi:hypothetical protein
MVPGLYSLAPLYLNVMVQAWQPVPKMEKNFTLFLKYSLCFKHNIVLDICGNLRWLFLVIDVY